MCTLEFTFLVFGNFMGTMDKNKKFPVPHPSCSKRKKLDRYECMLSLPIGCMKFLFPKLLVTILGLG
jgi:hypothetical protein